MNDLISQTFAQHWSIFAIIFVLLLGSTELGFRAGLSLFKRKDESRKRQIGGIQGTVFGMLGLLLGFTFAMAINRYESRREFVVTDANAIGTTYLRASLLPESFQTPMRLALREYVDLRIDYQAQAASGEDIITGRKQILRLHDRLWSIAMEAVKSSPTVTTISFIQSLNELIDTDAERFAAARAFIPGGVWILLTFVAMVGCFITGYDAGALGARTILGSIILPLLIVTIMVLIFDIAQPRQGTIRISQQPMLELQQTMKEALP